MNMFPSGLLIFVLSFGLKVPIKKMWPIRKMLIV